MTPDLSHSAHNDATMLKATVTGPRQSGKTTLCRAVAPHLPYANLERPDLREFALRDPRLIMSFALGVALLVPGWWLMDRLPLAAAAATHRPIHPGTVAGGLLFGVGWAVAGACPGIVLVQLGEGQLAALLTLVGVFAGNAIYALVHRRFFRFSTGSCSGE